ncbi:hypothetical protein EX30DRAFT_123185 [Ascodesmis nigricans]|uniref:Uncharacterized protein n=1 Tax=Ascodesmis nigricans TaxID=341454 RepID=A0A4S2MPI4_9PEZI|nr:hypothetical protein EX30DRAFT_123185 [Ascodesmis nigricans]
MRLKPLHSLTCTSIRRKSFSFSKPPLPASSPLSSPVPPPPSLQPQQCPITTHRPHERASLIPPPLRLSASPPHSPHSILPQPLCPSSAAPRDPMLTVRSLVYKLPWNTPAHSTNMMRKL